MKKKIIKWTVAVVALLIAVVGGIALYARLYDYNRERETDARFENECLECFNTAEKLFEKTCATQAEVGKYSKQVVSHEKPADYILSIAEKNGLVELSAELSLQTATLAKNWYFNLGSDSRRIKSGECRLLIARIEEFAQMYTCYGLTPTLSNEQVTQLKQDIEAYKKQVK